VEFRILGPLEVVKAGEPVKLGGARQRAVLALLLTNANRPVSVDALIDALWGARPPRNAENALQYHVSQLRKLLGNGETIVTRDPGYLIRVAPHDLDLARFERLVEEAGQASPTDAAQLLSDALDLWRGPPLADLAGEDFAQPEIRRLEEIRLAALERRLEADLALGRHTELIPELEAIVREYPLRERPRAALMRALYGAGRQAEALELYREARQKLVDELGIEPSPALQELERAILRHDPALAPEREALRRGGAILVVADEDDRLDDLLAIAEPLARRQPARELILARFLSSHDELPAASAALAAWRDELARRGALCRVAAYTTSEPGTDAALLATEQDVDLILLESPRDLLETGRADARLGVILEQAPCDVAVLTGNSVSAEGPVVTPFGGVEHDWSAIELAAWLAAALETTLRLLGTEADPALGQRDASRLLARASLLVQQMIGIVAEPLLIPAGDRGVVEATRDARLLVLGLSDRWPVEGIGSVRLAVAKGAVAPTLFVRRGLRPGGLAPSETMTRFTWTLGSKLADEVVNHRPAS
jgi:DNA-binding SARP family transcriptional activator